jgi:hypothetical protein
VYYGTVAEPERGAVPGADHARGALLGDDPALVQRTAEMRAVIGQHVDRISLAQRHQAQVPELAADGPPVGKFVQRAEVMPAERRQVLDRLGVAGASAEAQREVAAQVGADRSGGQPAGGQQLAVQMPPGQPG